jgi:hypothetical protein
VRKTCILLFTTIFLLFGLVFVLTGTVGPVAKAEQDDTPKMPEVIILGEQAKLGKVTFNHVKHNGGTYNIDKSSPIACISCHHSAQPESEILKHPPLKTSWPKDRTTTLTADLFAKDPKGAGVVGCRQCHTPAGTKPKLLDAIPEIKHEGSPALMQMTNQQAFHRACVGCHTEVKKTFPASKGPTQMQCTMCHKK